MPFSTVISLLCYILDGKNLFDIKKMKKFPINIIKLDKSFINAINENGIDTLLIKNILMLARDLEFEVIAEGIETWDQLEYLRMHFCDAGQGFLLSKPLPEGKMVDLLTMQYEIPNDRNSMA